MQKKFLAEGQFNDYYQSLFSLVKNDAQLSTLAGSEF